MTAMCFKTRDHHLPIKVRWVGRAPVPQRIRRCSRCCRAWLWIILLHYRWNDLHNRTVTQIIKFSRAESSDNSDCYTRKKKFRRNIIKIIILRWRVVPIYSVTVRTWKSGLPPTRRRKIKKKKNRSRGATRRGVYTGWCVQRPSIAEILGRMAPIDRRWSTDTRRPTECLYTCCACACVQARRGLGGARDTVLFLRFSAGWCVRVVCVPCVCMWARARRTVRSTRLRSSRPRWRLGGNTRESRLGGGGGGRAPYADSTPRCRPPAPSVPPRTGPVGGASSYIRRRRRQSDSPHNTPTPAEDVWWLLVCGVGCRLRGWSVVGLKECEAKGERGRRRPCRSRAPYTPRWSSSYAPPQSHCNNII